MSSGVEDEPLMGQPLTPSSALEMGLRNHLDHHRTRLPTSAAASAFPSENQLNQRNPFL